MRALAHVLLLVPVITGSACSMGGTTRSSPGDSLGSADMAPVALSTDLAMPTGSVDQASAADLVAPGVPPDLGAAPVGTNGPVIVSFTGELSFDGAPIVLEAEITHPMGLAHVVSINVSFGDGSPIGPMAPVGTGGMYRLEVSWASVNANASLDFTTSTSRAFLLEVEDTANLTDVASNTVELVCSYERRRAIGGVCTPVAEWSPCVNINASTMDDCALICGALFSKSCAAENACEGTVPPTTCPTSSTLRSTCDTPVGTSAVDAPAVQCCCIGS